MAHNVAEDYTAPVYEAPKIVKFVGGLLDTPMESRSASVTDFFSSDREAQASVVQGLFGLGCCFAGLAVFWFACLFILKCKGKKEAGCAAGYGFENINDYMDEQAEEEYLNSLDPQRPEHLPQQITISPNNTFDAEDYSDEVPLKKSPSSSSLRIIAIAATEPEDFCDEAISDELDYCDSLPQSSPNSSVSERRSPDSDFGYKHHTPSPQEIKTLMALEDYESDIAKVSRQLHSLPPPPPVPPIRSSSRFCTSSIRCGGCCSSHPSDTYTRRQWTRITFLISAVISIGCCAMILTEVRDPIKDVSQEVSELFVEGHAIIDQVQTTVNIMEDAAEVADETIAAIPLNLTKMCPGVPTRRNFTAEFALDPRGVIRFLQKDFETFLVRTARNIDEIQDITSKVEHGLTHAGILVEENIDNLWIVGFFAWTTIALTALLINGVAIAINTDSKRKQQQQELSGTSTTTKNHNNDTMAEQVLGWVILPTFIICIIIGWCLLIATSLSTVVASDVCVARGSPEETIRQALKIWELQEDEFVYNKVIAYTEGCHGDNPIQELLLLEDLFDEKLKFLQARLKEADTAGYDTMKLKCGEGNQIEDFFTGVHNVAGQLAIVRNSFGHVTDALSCPNINSLYARSVHEVLCTESASISATAFVLLFVVCIASMIMITLRASWRLSK